MTMRIIITCKHVQYANRTKLTVPQARTHCHQLQASGGALSSPPPAPPGLPGLTAPQTHVNPHQVCLTLLCFLLLHL